MVSARKMTSDQWNRIPKPADASPIDLERFSYLASNPQLKDLWANPDGNPNAALALQKSAGPASPYNNSPSTQLTLTRTGRGADAVAAVVVLNKMTSSGPADFLQPSIINQTGFSGHKDISYLTTIRLTGKQTTALVRNESGMYLVPVGADGKPVGKALNVDLYSSGTADRPDPLAADARDSFQDR
jgi:hypothetical protein